MIRLGDRIQLEDGSTPRLITAINGRVFVEHDEPVPYSIGGIVQPDKRRKVWATVPHRVVRDRDGVMVGVELPAAQGCDCCGSYGRPGYIYNANQWMSCPTCNTKMIKESTHG